jgi:hypothetical protein
MPHVSDGIDRRGETGEGDGQHEECRQWINPNGEGEQRDSGGERSRDGLGGREAEKPQNDACAGCHDSGGGGRDNLSVGLSGETERK